MIVILPLIKWGSYIGAAYTLSGIKADFRRRNLSLGEENVTEFPASTREKILRIASRLFAVAAFFAFGWTLSPAIPFLASLQQATLIASPFVLIRLILQAMIRARYC